MSPAEPRAVPPPVPRLAGLRAVVTGSSSGIGRGIAVAFARAGASVVVHGNRRIREAERLAQELRDTGATAVALEADLRDPGARKALVERSFAALGGMDVWVNNAGADILTGGNHALQYEAKLADLLDVDVGATMVLTREVGRRMRVLGSGSIINMGWDQAATGMEGDSGELFAAAKGAVMAFSKSAALSLAPEVRVNCIAPGWIRTRWGEGASPAWQERVLAEVPLRRWGLPGDVAEVAVFLASKDAAFLTGQVVFVNGGAVR